MRINKDNLEETIIKVVNDTITDEEYNDRNNLIKIRRMDTGETLAHFSVVRKNEKIEKIQIMMLGIKPRSASPLMAEVMRLDHNATCYYETMMQDYALGIKQYIMLFERKI